MYKYNTKCAPQMYLPAEEVLLDNILGEEVAVNKIICDSSLLGLFAAYIGQPPEKDVIYSTEVVLAAM